MITKWLLGNAHFSTLIAFMEPLIYLVAFVHIMYNRMNIKIFASLVCSSSGKDEFWPMNTHIFHGSSLEFLFCLCHTFIYINSRMNIISSEKQKFIVVLRVSKSKKVSNYSALHGMDHGRNDENREKNALVILFIDFFYSFAGLFWFSFIFAKLFFRFFFSFTFSPFM